MKHIGAISSRETILGLGSEGNATYSILQNATLSISESFGDIAIEENFKKYESAVREAIADVKLSKIAVDCHPEYASTALGIQLSKELNIPLVRVQHHHAHVFSAAFENQLKDFVGIAIDGTGFGLTNEAWGGEVFDVKDRIGSLEENYLIGGDASILHPKRLLISHLSKFLPKDKINKYIMLPESEFELLYRTLKERFNCVTTTSCGRTLDAASALLGFSSYRDYPGSPAIELAKNSTTPYELKPAVVFEGRWIASTVPLFKFLVANIDKDRKKLAATCQKYLADGFIEVAKKYNKPIVASGGCMYNKIITDTFRGAGIKTNVQLEPGDSSISAGQIAFLTYPWD